MWRELVKAAGRDCSFFPGALEDEIASVEKNLNVALPEELKSLLEETNGVHGEYGLGLIWNLDRIEKDNLNFRRNTNFRDLYMPFDSLLFIGDAGNGDQFTLAICNGMIRRGDVFVWNHEDDSRTWIAPSLKNYLEGWLSGKINI